MIEIKGKYTDAIIYTDTPDDKAIAQIRELCDQPFAAGARVRVMPDYHWGLGCTIGFTADLGDKIVPNLVGVDIGCGMCVAELGRGELDVRKLDRVIHSQVPSGAASHRRAVERFAAIEDLHCLPHLGKAPSRRQGSLAEHFQTQIGTLGGGNHFIEAAADDQGEQYLVIHSGSRNMGKRVAEYYQAKAERYCRREGNDVSRGLAYLEGQDREEYLHDMRICQEYASFNRLTMARLISEYWLNGAALPGFQTIHNYVSFEDGVIRKGAVRAAKGEKLIIPLNMRDGSLICVGKGNGDWNQSAPHGAGRVMGRREALRRISLNDFRSQMRSVYSTTVAACTLDEAPDAYKPADEILRNIGDTVEVVKTIRPLYNYKAGAE